ncbi:hypothetical protein [Streptomyces javensis]|uniref:Uncharacterized protein n=1 Tax=Streptomyces javensis TaxID=114698 RepID=A0ABS0R6Q1_9ACTN|nr:hypothetical protein [Streptomyces javensis]MBI0313047.1 hypothetical protein [Streptomyces javensis]
MDTCEASWEDSNQDIAEAVMWAADEGKPLVVTTAKGDIVRMIPEAAAETEPEDRAAAAEGVVAYLMAE